MECSKGHEFDPDSNFCCKMAYIRSNGGLKLRWQGGKRSFFHESTIAERQREIVARAKANGRDVRPLNPFYDRPARFDTSTKNQVIT